MIYQNIYQLSFSPDYSFAIFSIVDSGGSPDLYVASKDTPSAKRITQTQGIEFDPAINNAGNYAYAYHDSDVGLSTVYVDNVKLDYPIGLYKNMALHNKTLVMHYSSLSDYTNWLIEYDLDTQISRRTKLSIYPSEIKFNGDSLVLMQGFNEISGKNDILTYDTVSQAINTFYESNLSRSCFIDENSFGSNFQTICFTDNQAKEQLLYLGLDYLLKHDPALSLANSSNSLGRLSWNVSYRLEALVALHNLNLTDSFPTKEVINSTVKSLLKTVDRIDDKGSIGWPTNKYSINGKDELSLLVDNAAVLYPMLLAVNQGHIDTADKKRVVALAIKFYDHYEPSYDYLSGHYCFEKGIPFWSDGIWLPYNMQNIWGLCLIELYKVTTDSKYKARALKLAEVFKNEWAYVPDGRILWHYWPQEFYAGWDATDNLSINTPSRSASTDSRYEDLSHAGINLKFILEIQHNFPDGSITGDDINAMKMTASGFRYGDNYSRFMGGDILYQPASKMFMPQYGWNEIGDLTLNEQIKNGIPAAYPLFEGDLAASYLLTLSSMLSLNGSSVK